MTACLVALPVRDAATRAVTAPACTRLAVALAVSLVAPCAHAQSAAAPNARNADDFRVEVAGLWWHPDAAIVLASDVAGVPGTPIDFKRDLGLSERGLPGLQIDVALAAKHRVRFEYLPIRYRAYAVTPQDLFFDGGRYPAGTAVTSTFDWKAWRVGYEYDFLVGPQVSAGLIVEGRQTDITVHLTGASVDHVVRTRIPIPAAGGIVRVRAAPRVSLGAEMDFFKVPDNARKNYGGRYLDVDVSATARLGAGWAARGGFRSLAVRHLGETDAGTLRLNGAYLGAVIRF
jgi:hypothetical protein